MEPAPMTHARWRPLHGLLLLALAAGSAFVPAFRIWPLFWVAPLLGYAAVVGVTPPLRAGFRPWGFGRITRHTVAAAVIIALGSCVTLIAFQYFTRPDLSGYARFLPVSTVGGALAAGALFSVFNALCEEIIFRGILFDSIESEWGAPVAVIATAVLFGYGHMRGYPPGPLGAALAGFYGLCLGWLRVFSRGLGLPFLAHIVADATIFGIVAWAGLR